MAFQGKIGRNDPCWCGSGRKYKKCHMEQDRLKGGSCGSFDENNSSSRPVSPGLVTPMRDIPAHIKCPDYAVTGGEEHCCRGCSSLSGGELDQMRKTCRAARRVLNKAIEGVRPGITTDQIDAVVHQACIDEGGYPSPRNYRGFPKSVCTSVNEVICHGIPDARPLDQGDIVNIDVTIFMNGLHGDCSETVPVGDIDEPSLRLVETARECLQRGIAAIHPRGWVKDIGCSITEYAHRNGFSVVRAYCGHGIGRCFHMDPQVSHYRDNKVAARLEPGMVFTVEPMINMGTWRHQIWDDRWTAVTADGKRSAQFEDTVLVTEQGTEILTSVKGTI